MNYRAQLYSIVIFLVFAAYLQVPDTSQYDSKRVLQLISLSFIGMLFILSRIRQIVFLSDNSLNKSFTSSKITVTSLAFLFVAGLISVILSENYQYALLEFSFLFLLITLVIALAPATLKKHYLLGKLITVTAIVFSAIYVTVFFGNYISSFFNPMILPWPDKYDFTLIVNGVELSGKEVLYFDHRRFFNHTQTWTLPILLGLLTYYKGLKYNKQIVIALIFLISCWWMLIFASGGRGSIVGIIVALLLILAICKKHAFQLFKNGAITLSLGGLFYFIFFRFLIPDSGGIPFLRNTDSGRFNMWEKAIEMWTQDPFFGAGPMHYAKISDAPFAAHPHNFYVQLFSEWGLLGFAAFAALGFVFVNMVYKNYHKIDRNSSNQTIYLAFTWSILAAFIHAFFSGVMHTSMSQMWLIIIAAWFIGFQRYEYSVKNIITTKYHLQLIYLLLLIPIIWIVTDDIINMTENYGDYFSKHPESIFYPRFWIQGLFE